MTAAAKWLQEQEKKNTTLTQLLTAAMINSHATPTNCCGPDRSPDARSHAVS